MGVDADAVRDLYHASTCLSELGLYHAAKWVAEALNGLPKDQVDAAMATVATNGPLFPTEYYQCLPTEQAKFTLAKCYFQCKEFDRAALTLAPLTLPCCVFLRLYARVIAIDKRATEELDGLINWAVPKLDVVLAADDDDQKSPPAEDTLRAQLTKILQEIDTLTRHQLLPNPFYLYLAGAIYNKQKKYLLAAQYLVKLVLLFPYNWLAWKELALTLTTLDEALQLLTKLKQAPKVLLLVFDIFEVVVLQQFYQSLPELVDRVMALQHQFPHFYFLKVQQFLIAYHLMDYVKAEQVYDDILVGDPLRLDDLDTFSNMLYVMEKRLKLLYLAHYALQVDKFRPETCCVVANYHSMKGEHEKAIMYYQRALALNKQCISAWTLMGHEFVELKNSHAAIESYRRAVDQNPRDFRAWYGLGQAYEVLDMNLYALYYYQKATNLQPLDKRMWQALGNCYEKLDKLEEAAKAFEKALMIDNFRAGGAHHGDDTDGDAYQLVLEPHVVYRLAIISEKLGQVATTFRYMKLCFGQEYEWGETDETTKARLWLARHALENKRFDEAYELAKELNRGNAHDIEEARLIARDARSRMK